MASLVAGNTSSSYAFALASYQHELKHLKTNFEQAREERDRLRVNVAEANARSALIAQEVDEHHAKMEKASENRLMTLEKRHSEQLREVTEELQRERETTTLQLSRLRQRSEDELSALRADEIRLRAQLAALEQVGGAVGRRSCDVTRENRRLELELQEYSERYSELHRLGETQQKELESVVELKQKSNSLDSLLSFNGKNKTPNSVAYLFLYTELTINAADLCEQELKDSNDELTLELETLRQQQGASRTSAHGKRHRRSGSWVSDYSRQGGLKRRGSEASSSEESDDDIPIAGKIRKRAGFSVSSSGPEGIPCVADAYQLTLEAEDLGEAQREPLERLRMRFEQALRDIEERWRQRVVDLEAQLCGQPEVDKDSIDCAQSTIAKLQDELSMRNVLAERLRADVTALQNQLSQQREQLAAELALRERELAQLAEQRRASEARVQALQASWGSVSLEETERKAKEELVCNSEAWKAEREALLSDIELKTQQIEDLKRTLAEAATGTAASICRQRTDAEAVEPSNLQAVYESRLAEVRCQVEEDLVRKVRTDVERELRTSLEQNLKLQPSRRSSDPQAQLRPQDLTAQLTEDICQLLRQCLRCGGAAGSDAPASDARLQGGAGSDDRASG
ncbi:hypothetical protein HPB48_014630 [Haemaphysalis longicornis]|uniref:Uncharacterized protein n=1 Tax=Haemaphysalis longicornis TaxID=44386 RepID=A0A9J6GKK8_HAELO|nr:hypothetical protein HPB48_014630 [Haemaphysalis longicornis]